MTTNSKDTKDTVDQTPQRDEKKRNENKSDGMDGKASLFGGAPQQSTSDEQILNGENWVELCARAAVEQDPRKLLELVSEINRLLEVRKNRLSKAADRKR
jgi:hypothetical protein